MKQLHIICAHGFDARKIMMFWRYIYIMVSKLLKNMHKHINKQESIQLYIYMYILWLLTDGIKHMHNLIKDKVYYLMTSQIYYQIFTAHFSNVAVEGFQGSLHRILIKSICSTFQLQFYYYKCMNYQTLIQASNQPSAIYFIWVHIFLNVAEVMK